MTQAPDKEVLLRRIRRSLARRKGYQLRTGDGGVVWIVPGGAVTNARGKVFQVSASSGGCMFITPETVVTPITLVAHRFTLTMARDLYSLLLALKGNEKPRVGYSGTATSRRLISTERKT